MVLLCAVIAAFTILVTWAFAAESTRTQERDRAVRICRDVADFSGCKLDAAWVESLNREHGVVVAHCLSAQAASSSIEERILSNES